MRMRSAAETMGEGLECTMRNTHHRRGLFLIEFLVGLGCIGILVGIVYTIFGMRSNDAGEQRSGAEITLRDQMQLRMLHQSMIIFSNENRDRFPVPGLVNRIGDIPGVGAEDISLNTTANMFSLMIAQDFFNPDLCISPAEVSSKVKEDADYNYDAYNIAEDSYWDASFVADLAVESNVSYAHMPIEGQGKIKEWRYSENPQAMIIGTRGPGPLGDASKTLRMHGPEDVWQGNVVFNDNRTAFMDSRMHNGNDIFSKDDGGPFLTFTRAVVDGVFSYQFD